MVQAGILFIFYLIFFYTIIIFYTIDSYGLVFYTYILTYFAFFKEIKTYHNKKRANVNTCNCVQGSGWAQQVPSLKFIWSLQNIFSNIWAEWRRAVGLIVSPSIDEEAAAARRGEFHSFIALCCNIWECFFL